MARKSKLNAGVIGLGIIGSRIAANLRKAGFQVYVWNRTPKPAPNFLASPAEVAGICDIIQIVVADSQALFSIIEAMGGALSARHTVVCSATVGARATIEAARQVEAKGAKFLDAPFTGSKMAAEKGELVYYIGGAEQAFRNAEPMLEATSKAIVKIGATGDAATVKIATNMLAAVTVQTLAEACALLRKSGIDPAALTRALEHHSARSGLIDMKLPKIIAGDHETNFSIKHMFKDVQLAIQAANHFDIDIPATTATAGALYGGINQGWADLDFTAVAKFYEEEEPEPAPALPAPPVTTAEPVETAKTAEIMPPPAVPVEAVAAPVEKVAPPVETAASSAEKATPPAENAVPESKAAEKPADIPPPPAEPLSPPVENAAPEAQSAQKPADISTPAAEPPFPPFEKQTERTVEIHPPAAAAPPEVKSAEITPEPAIAPPPKPKRPLPPIKPQKTTSHWFGVGRKK